MQTNEQNVKKLKGFTIRALKCWIKALELGEGVEVSQRAYRYELSKDGTTARIVRTADGSEVEGTNRTVEEWANVGRPARLALIGLKDRKIELREKGTRVLFKLNVVTGEAFLHVNGVPMAEYPQTITEWAELGRAVEKPYFEQLNAAREWKIKDAEESVWKQMVARGIVRDKAQEAGSSGDSAEDGDYGE